ncbi:MetQ/NlpA family ABC transporter substrate-binding protein [uncultured Granulicatella sp.]|uniref:MetQ/NlpA family ABC transporter substrate-binding protein n=1 Tax=uncultured Granulicatella sp. TaxID=316089 RepID=UPI00261683E2|nr:MetQ/NlpA family ABC transporter substrate-binding protein [uncultured Granulicatella sp.]
MNIKKLFVAAVAALTLAACGAAQSSNSGSNASTEAKKEVKQVKLGVNAGNQEVWNDVIARLKEKEGIAVELVEFTDYVQPNQALENGDVDLNAFQTIIYLERFNKEQGTHIKPIGYTVIAPMGVYSKKIKNVSELKDGDTIAIPEDTSNNSRALRLLHAAGVIKLKDPSNTLATKDDIVENPKNIQIKELPAGQTARALDDVAASLINNGFAVEAGFQPTKDAIFIEEITDSSKPYYNVIAVKEGNENNEVYKKVVEYYQTEQTAKKIEEVTKGASVPVWTKAKLNN